MTKAERKHIRAIIRYVQPEIVYDEWVYDEWVYTRLQENYRRWLKNLLKYGDPDHGDQGS